MSKEIELVEKLTKNHYTISTAESCTGGLVAGTIVNVSGASSVYDGGFVTYANSAKMKFVNVSEETLIKHGAVSEQTAKEMALGCAKAMNANVGISTTGIAGPTGGTKDKPVGLVFIGCSINNVAYVEKNIFKGSRLEVRNQAVDRAIGFTLECLERV